MKLKKRRLGRPKMSFREHLGLSDEPSYNDAKDALVQVYETKGPGAAVSLLTRFEVEKLSELPKRHFGKFITLCRELLGDH